MQEKLQEIALEGPPKRIPLERAFNFRDLGGYRTGGHQRLRRGKLYRSDDLFRLSDRDLAVLSELGIKTVIDLRTEAEAGRGRFPAEKYPVNYFQNSLIDISADHTLAHGEGARDYIYLRYTQILNEGREGIRQVFSQLVRRDAAPTVFHCVAGKDRTGLVAAITLEVLGVEREQVLEDYSLTKVAMREAIEWLESESPTLAARMSELPPVVLSAEPENLARVLSWLDERHGGAEGYLLSLGLASAELSGFRSWMLE
ncbi:MAG: tyrosine-protein phosphatase [Actinomycetota bacterium]|nr:tyrosine-protein phosphatase [Actinomycetota bacterium]